MKDLKIILPAAAAVGSLVAVPAYAHGFGERTELPVPLVYFLIGAGLAVALSFLFISVLVKASGESSYWRFNLIGTRWSQAILTSHILLVPIKLFSVFLLGIVIATGYWGESAPLLNFSPTFIWIIWWVGMSIFIALIGNVWALINAKVHLEPGKVIEDGTIIIRDGLIVDVGVELEIPQDATPRIELIVNDYKDYFF